MTGWSLMEDLNDVDPALVLEADRFWKQKEPPKPRPWWTAVKIVVGAAAALALTVGLLTLGQMTHPPVHTVPGMAGEGPRATPVPAPTPAAAATPVPEATPAPTPAPAVTVDQNGTLHFADETTQWVYDQLTEEEFFSKYLRRLWDGEPYPDGEVRDLWQILIPCVVWSDTLEDGTEKMLVCVHEEDLAFLDREDGPTMESMGHADSYPFAITRGAETVITPLHTELTEEGWEAAGEAVREFVGLPEGEDGMDFYYAQCEKNDPYEDRTYEENGTAQRGKTAYAKVIYSLVWEYVRLNGLEACLPQWFLAGDPAKLTLDPAEAEAEELPALGGTPLPQPTPGAAEYSLVRAAAEMADRYVETVSESGYLTDCGYQDLCIVRVRDDHDSMVLALQVTFSTADGKAPDNWWGSAAWEDRTGRFVVSCLLRVDRLQDRWTVVKDGIALEDLDLEEERYTHMKISVEPGTGLDDAGGE